MHWLRFLNPFYTLDLERKVAAIPGLRRAVRSLVESVRRQALPGETTELRAELIVIADDLRAVHMRMRHARDLLACGLTTEALTELEAAIGDAPAQREAS
jgi:hypothetical protein